MSALALVALVLAAAPSDAGLPSQPLQELIEYGAVRSFSLLRAASLKARMPGFSRLGRTP